MKTRFVGLVAIALSSMSLPAQASDRAVVVRYVGKETHRQELRGGEIHKDANGIRVGHKFYALSSNGTTNVTSTGARPEWVLKTRDHRGTQHLGWLPKQAKKP